MTRALVGNAGDPQQVRKAKVKARIKDAQRVEDLAFVMNSAQGRRFVWWVLGISGIHESVMRDGKDMASYWSGRQDFGHILQERLVKTVPDSYLLMQTEAIQEEKREAPPEAEERETSDDLGNPEE